VLAAGLLLGVLALLRTVASSAATDEEIATATRLLASGRLEEAEPLVARLRREEAPPLQVLFLSGAIFLERGRYDDAAEEFRRMLVRDPTLLRPRLELARALFLAGDYQAARYHFEQVLSVPLPETVRNNVLAYLTLIRERVPSLVLSLDLQSPTPTPSRRPVPSSSRSEAGCIDRRKHTRPTVNRGSW
jgi:Flp pilus assembly protein TadD